MPDDHHSLMPRRNPEDIDLGAIKTDLESLIERGERFRKAQARKPVYTMVGSAVIVIAWIEMCGGTVCEIPANQLQTH